jgi:hypothetical protein
MKLSLLHIYSNGLLSQTAIVYWAKRMSDLPNSVVVFDFEVEPSSQTSAITPNPIPKTSAYNRGWNKTNQEPV